jgi:hypothetical protein
MMDRLGFLAAPLIAACVAVPAAANEIATDIAAELVMVEQRGCLYCKMWHDDVGPEEYALTPEGAAAPLRRIDLRPPYPEDLTFSGPLRITPTFVLVEDGVEVARLEGYPGEDFFWGLLGRMLGEHTDFKGGQP